MAESSFKAKLKKELSTLFPGSLVLDNDAGHIQGIPDLLILYKKHWAGLECKKGIGASHRPNQDYYVEQMNNMSYAAFISPENKEEILNAVQRALQP